MESIHLRPRLRLQGEVLNGVGLGVDLQDVDEPFLGGEVSEAGEGGWRGSHAEEFSDAEWFEDGGVVVDEGCVGFGGDFEHDVVERWHFGCAMEEKMGGC